MDEHTATTELARKTHNCPFFQQGCPFGKQQTFDAAEVKKHPAFSHGCPYKNVALDKIKECPAFKDHKCPFDGSHKLDLSRVHECPAFKDGSCPFKDLKLEKHDHSSMTGHAATEHIATEASKCPVFAHSNCPFDPQHPHSLDLSKVSMCPAFQRTGGSCPFKNVHVERLQECPAFKDGKCPFDGSKPIDMSRIKECPAFQKGCPYSHLHSTVTLDAATHTVAVMVSQEARQCPFFAQKNGGCPYDPQHLKAIDLSKAKDCPHFKINGVFQCPYKNVKLERLHECPAFKDGKCPFDAPTIDLSRLRECPAFKDGKCPYKETASSEGAKPAPSNPNQNQEQAATQAPHGHPPGDPAKCPFHAMHSKVDNPHK